MTRASALDIARPHIAQLSEWMRHNRITLAFTDGNGRWRHERWLIHPSASDKQLIDMCIPYFSTSGCRDCEWSYRPHPLLKSGENSYLHLCTKAALAQGVIREKGIGR